jgi:hypothetical protein
MKHSVWTVLLLVAVFAQACSGAKPTLDTPEHTFAALVTAIQQEDLATYERCWHPDKAPSEGLVALLKTDASTWTRLKLSFVEGSKLVNRKDASEDGKTIAAFDVDSPLDHGPEGVSLVQVGGEWKMWHW